MLNPETISDLKKAFEAERAGFLVVDSGVPRFAVLGYETYRKLKHTPADVHEKGKILVTGGAGYIGSHTVRVLQEQGYEVVVYDNLSTGRREAVRDCKFIEADLADRSALDKVFSEEAVDAVIHFAASVEVEESVRNPAKYFQNNVTNGLHLLDAMVEHEVSKLVFSSSAAVYGEPQTVPVTEDSPCKPTNPYGESKLIFEQFLKRYGEAYGVHSVSLRYFNAAGAWAEADLGYNRERRESHLVPRVLDVAARKTSEIEVYGQDYATPDRTCIRDYIHVLDLAEAHVLALQKLETSNGSYIYNVGTGLGHSVLEVVDTAVEVTGRMIPIRFSSRRAGDPERLVADSSKLMRELEWRPKHDLASILKSAWEWHKMQT